MDIHLEDGDSFKILNSVTINNPIIFCTTFNQYAIEAFKYNSIDYLLKPVKKEAVAIALEKYLNLKKSLKSNATENLNDALDTNKPISYKKRFLIRDKNKLKLIFVANVVCFYSNDGDTRLIENNGNEHIVDFTMERLEKIVNPKCFFRINRKMSVNIDYIHSVEDYFNNRLKVRMQKDTSLDLIVSRKRVKEFKVWLRGVS